MYFPCVFYMASFEAIFFNERVVSAQKKILPEFIKLQVSQFGFPWQRHINELDCLLRIVTYSCSSLARPANP